MFKSWILIVTIFLRFCWSRAQEKNIFFFLIWKDNNPAQEESFFIFFIFFIFQVSTWSWKSNKNYDHENSWCKILMAQTHKKRIFMLRQRTIDHVGLHFFRGVDHSNIQSNRPRPCKCLMGERTSTVWHECKVASLYALWIDGKRVKKKKKNRFFASNFHGSDFWSNFGDQRFNRKIKVVPFFFFAQDIR